MAHRPLRAAVTGMHFSAVAHGTPTQNSSPGTLTNGVQSRLRRAQQALATQQDINPNGRRQGLQRNKKTKRKRSHMLSKKRAKGRAKGRARRSQSGQNEMEVQTRSSVPDLGGGWKPDPGQCRLGSQARTTSSGLTHCHSA